MVKSQLAMALLDQQPCLISDARLTVAIGLEALGRRCNLLRIAN